MSDNGNTSPSGIGRLPLNEGTPPSILLDFRRVTIGALLETALQDRGYPVQQSSNLVPLPPGAQGPELLICDFHGADSDRLLELSIAKSMWGNPLLLGVAPPQSREELLSALKYGIDDFVFEPFNLPELEQRINLSLSRRAQSRSGDGYRLVERRRVQFCSACRQREVAKTSFEVDERSKTVRVQGREVQLTPREYRIVQYLGQNNGRIHTIQEILAAVWPRGSRASASDVHQYIYSLRKKLEEFPDKPRWIKNVKGFGYWLDPVGSISSADSEGGEGGNGT